MPSLSTLRADRLLRGTDRMLAALAIAFATLLAGCVSAGDRAVIVERPDDQPETVEIASPPSGTEAIAGTDAALDTVQVGPFDSGKMWTFENPPLDYFEQTYGFRPDGQWLNKARLAALRFSDNCSASFVSPNGLVMTNHHCARESISDVSRSGEQLLRNGFLAASTAEERKVDGLTVEQLVEIDDVTAEVNDAVRRLESNELEARAEARSRQAAQLEERLTREVQAGDSSLSVEVVELYDGSRFSAYTYRTYDDVRLVMAPELSLGFFGGSPDNFTYPRHTLDVSFFRVYDDDGQPLGSGTYFPWSGRGAKAGDAVFVVGNPGSTDRLSTVSQLAFQRDYALPQQLDALRAREAILADYVAEHPEEAEEYDVENLYFSIQNSIKATQGELEGLRDPYLIARREAAEEALQDSIAAVDSLRSRYGEVVTAVEQVQRARRTTARQSDAFTYFTSGRLGSRILTRGVYGYFYDQLRQRPRVSEKQLASIREEALGIEDWPATLEEHFIALRLREVREALGPTDPTVRRVLQGRTPEEVAARLAQQSALADSAGFAPLLEEGYQRSDDPSVAVIQPLASLFLEVNRQQSDYASSEESLGAELAEARFSVYGTDVPPDATFSLRLADGVVRGYDYNGTTAPPHTNFFGLYDYYYAFGVDPWNLPAQWVDEREDLDLSTPLNLVSTNDITGGNSGSPLLNERLQIVGLVFDSNVEALPNTFLYTDVAARAISVDARGILEALGAIYEAEALIRELTTGQMGPSEADASSRR